VCNAFDAYRTRPGDTVVVIGAGPIGALHVLVSKLAGGRVIAADVSESRLRGMEKYGADLLVPSASVDLKAEVDRFTGGRGADVIITACSVPAVQSLALHLAAPRGRVSLFGGLPAGKEEVPLNTNLIHYKELCVTATTGSRMQDLHSAIKLLASGLLDVSGLITARFPLEETAAAFDYAATGAGLKAVVIPGLTAGARDGRRPA
jgi:threonine dehydrogenase-like Zn-dependent dehydrogenase